MEEQFQYQLQRQYTLISNSVNTNINELSYFNKNQLTSFTWIDGYHIWKKTISGVITGTSVNPTPHGLTAINTVVAITGNAQNATPLTAFGLPLPYVDPVTPATSLGLFIDTTNLYVNAGDNTWNTYQFNVTIYYTKVKDANI